MANTRISDLTPSVANLAAADVLPVVQTTGVGPVKMTGTQIKTGIIGAGSVSIASTKTLTANNTLTLAGTDSTTITFGGASSSFPIVTSPTAATLQLGAADAAAPVAQTFKVQSVVAGTSNTAGTNFTIQGSAGTGTGAGGSIIFQVAPAGSSGTAQNAYADLLTLTTNAGGEATFSLGTNRYFIIQSRTAGVGSFWAQAGTGAIGVTSGGYLSWTNSATSAFATQDLFLLRDAANTLALRNGTSAQTFNVYGTYTAADNFERLSIQYGASSDYVLRTEKGGSGGSSRSLTFETYGIATFTIAAQTLATSNDGFYSWSTTSSSRGTAKTRLYRDADGIMGLRGEGTTQPAAMSLYTYGASPPAAPAASIVRIYADTSGGKIRLMALFPSGAAQQIAIEP